MKPEKHLNRVICPKCGEWGTRVAQKIKCGKPECSKCPHGPYWYVFHWVGNKTKNCYIGKTWPTPEKEKKKGENKASIVTVQVPKGELEKLDDLVKKKMYPNRNEAFRIMVHDFLRQEGRPTPEKEKKKGMVAVWVPKGELEKLDELVKMKLYPNRDEAFRFAVHDLLKRELNILPQA